MTKPTIELINPVTPRKLTHAFFDFDGTLSLIRRGWQPIMFDLFLRYLPVVPGETDEQRKAMALNDITELTGQQTIYQMMRLASRIRERGDEPRTPEEYKAEYLGNLKALNVDARKWRLEDGLALRREFLLCGAIAFLEALLDAGVEMVLFSGTDHADVLEEADLLGLGPYFGDRMFGATPDLDRSSKRRILQHIAREWDGNGETVAVFGDGPVELEEGKRISALAIGIASSEDHNGEHRIDLVKRERLVAAGADLVIPDFAETEELLKTICRFS
jgi:phosphoglycolate phosphatase-like HAD superfamily hydrolase